MQCREFHQLLPLLLNGTISPALRDACDTHLDGCGHCVETIAAASATLFEAPDANAILRNIVQATIPELCTASANLLCESLDNSPGEAESVLLAGHLQDCPHCQQLLRNLQKVRQELSSLAVLQPPEELLGQILLATSGKPSAKTHHPYLLPGQIRRVLLRPRFALEAAFAATLLWSILFGIPASVLDTASADQPAMIERLELRQIWTQTQSGLEQEIAELGPEFSAPVSALENIFLNSVESAQRSGNLLWLRLNDWIDSLGAGLVPGPQ